MIKSVLAAALIVLAAPSLAKNPNAVNVRVNATCSSIAQSYSYVANADAVYGECIEGAKTAYQGNDAKCEKNLATFVRKGKGLVGADRAEWVAFTEAWRAGCNIGKNSRQAGY